MVVTISVDMIKLLKRRWPLDIGEAEGRQWVKAAGI
jgi:hypothetical protein